MSDHTPTSEACTHPLDQDWLNYRCVRIQDKPHLQTGGF